MQPAKSSLPGSNGHHQHYGPAGSYPGVAQANGSTAGQPTGTLSQIPSYAAAYQQPYQYAQAQPYGSLYAAQAYAEQPGFKQLAAQGAAPARYDAAAYAYALQHFAPPAPAAQQQQQAWPQQASYPQHAAYSHTTAYAQHAAYPQQSAYPAHLAGAYPAPSGSNTYQQPARSSNMQRLLNAANTYRDQHQPASPSHQQPARSHQQQPAAAQHALPRPAASQQVPAADQPPGRAVSCPTSTATQHAAPAALTHAPSEVTQPARQAQPAHASPAPHASQHALPTAQPQHGSDRLRERQYDDGTRFSDEEEDRKEHPSSGWDSDSDGHPGRSRKRGVRSARGRPPKRVKQATPPVNEMREKLRSAAAADTPSPEPAAAQEPEHLAVPALERQVSAEQEQEELEKLRGNYHMAVVFEFMSAFRYAAGLMREFESEHLERALIRSPGGPGLLADVHIELLRGISPRSDITPHNWTAVLADRLKRSLFGTHLKPPFFCSRGHEAVAYAALPTEDRVLALEMLCDLRLDREDLRIGVEESLKPPPKPPKLPKGPPQLPKEQPSRASTRSTRYAPPAPPELPPAPRPSPPVAPGGILRLPLRKEAMGADASGTVYWLIDMGRPWGTRLYKETSLAPASKKGTPAPKQRGSQAQPVPAPALELIGTTIEEMQAIGERLSRSKRKPDQRIASILVDEVVPSMAAAAAEELRQAKAAERLRNQLGSVMDLGFGRPKRERKQVNYSYDAYDDMIRDAIRGRRGEGGVPSSRHSDFQSELEDSRRSLRRGRSATGPETEHELSPSRRAVTRTPPPPHAHSPVPRNQPAFDGEQHALHGARFREDDLRERSQTEDEPWDRAGDVSDGGSYPDAADGDAEDADRQDDLRWGYRSEHGGHGREYSDEPEEGSQPSGSYQDGFRAASHELEHARRPHDVEISE